MSQIYEPLHPDIEGDYVNEVVSLRCSMELELIKRGLDCNDVESYAQYFSRVGDKTLCQVIASVRQKRGNSGRFRTVVERFLNTDPGNTQCIVDH